MRYARIVDGVVAEILDLDESRLPAERQLAPEFAAQLVRTDDPDVRDGYLWDGKQFQPEPPPTPPELSPADRVRERFFDWLLQGLTWEQMQAEIEKIKSRT